MMLTVAVLLCGGSAFAQTFSCDAPPPAVVDDGYDGSLASMSCCTITASDFGSGTTVDDVDVEVSVNSTWVGDLTIKVQSPTGTITTLQSRAGFAEPADDGGSCCGASVDWLDDLILYDDDGGDPVAEDMGIGGLNVCTGGGAGGDGVCAHVPFPDTGPGTNLADFDGEDLVGAWQVCVGDSAGGDPTTFNDAQITLGAIPVELQSFSIE
jgi:hypothetical protein